MAKLTATTLRNMKKPDQGKRFNRLYDGHGLFAYYMRRGTRPWRFRYHDTDGKERWITIGEYPSMSLGAARVAAAEIRTMLAQGIDPKLAKQKKTAVPIFTEAARQWLEHASKNWRSDHTKEIAEVWVNNDLQHAFGGMALSDVNAGHIVAFLRQVEAEGHDYKLRRIYGYLKRIFSFSISNGWCSHNPAAELVLRDLFRPYQKEKRPAFTNEKDIARLMRLIHGYDNLTVRHCLIMASLLFARPGELRRMKWAEIDLEKREWRYFVTKVSKDHAVPLSSQALTILAEQKKLSWCSDYVFPGHRSNKQPISENTLNAALRALGIDTKREHCAHGFRAMARTSLAELGYPKDYIELQLSHKIGRSESEQAYAREQHLPDRHQMMQTWADYLDALRNGDDVSHFKYKGI